MNGRRISAKRRFNVLADSTTCSNTSGTVIPSTACVRMNCSARPRRDRGSPASRSIAAPRCPPEAMRISCNSRLLRPAASDLGSRPRHNRFSRCSTPRSTTPGRSTRRATRSLSTPITATSSGTPIPWSRQMARTCCDRRRCRPSAYGFRQRLEPAGKPFGTKQGLGFGRRGVGVRTFSASS